MATSSDLVSSVNLAALPQVNFAPQSTADVESAVLTAYERLAGVTLQPGDPVRLFLESLAYTVSVQNSLIDLAGRQGLLAYAEQAHLDHLGAIMGVTRIPRQPAHCTLRFALGEALGFDVPVPSGTRAATRDGTTAFATEAEAVIRAGDLFVDVPAKCTEPGAAASGLVPGQVASLMDPLPYVVNVRNVSVSVDGADAESDARLRERIRIAPESYTVAGSSGAYIARVLAARSDVAAVTVHSPEPGVVDVRFVLTNGELPDAHAISMVSDALTAEEVRPLTDKVLVSAPDTVSYALRGQWYLRRGDAALLSGVTTAVERAVEEYRLWQRGQPGRDINPSQLVALVQSAGAKRVHLEEPAFLSLTDTQIARESIVEFSFGGLEDA